MTNPNIVTPTGLAAEAVFNEQSESEYYIAPEVSEADGVAGTESVVEIAADQTSDQASTGGQEFVAGERMGRLQSVKEWVRGHKMVTAAGTLAVGSTVATSLTADFGQIATELTEKAPWVGAGLVASEVSWVAGGAAMLAASGAHVRNIFRVRKQAQQMMDGLHGDDLGRPVTAGRGLADNKLFRTGFALNAVGALGTAGTLTAGVIETLPPQSWGVLSLGALDVAQTLATRTAIWGALRTERNGRGNEQAGVELEAGDGVQAHEAGGETAVSDGRKDAVQQARQELTYAYDAITPQAQQPSFFEAVLAEPAAITAAEAARAEKEASRPVMRPVTEADIDQIVDLDLRMFQKAYGAEEPSREEVGAMMLSRLRNIQDGGGWMLACEVGGRIEGFITAFRTSKPQEKFRSWEDSTNNGTLDGVVDPKGRYIYVANLTVSPQASKQSGRQRLMAYSIGEAIKEGGSEYAYFESRMPGYKRWLKRSGYNPDEMDTAMLDSLAEEYVNLKQERDGKAVPVDAQIRMYESAGMERGVLVAGAFSDPESLGYGVVFTSPLPRMPRPVGFIAGAALAASAKMAKMPTKVKNIFD